MENLIKTADLSNSDVLAAELETVAGGLDAAARAASGESASAGLARPAEFFGRGAAVIRAAIEMLRRTAVLATPPPGGRPAGFDPNPITADMPGLTPGPANPPQSPTAANAAGSPPPDGETPAKPANPPPRAGRK